MFLTPKTWKNCPQKLLIIGPQLFFQYWPSCPNGPKTEIPYHQNLDWGSLHFWWEAWEKNQNYVHMYSFCSNVLWFRQGRLQWIIGIEMPDQKFNPCNCRIEIFFLVGLLVSNYDFENYILHTIPNKIFLKICILYTYTIAAFKDCIKTNYEGGKIQRFQSLQVWPQYYTYLEGSNLSYVYLCILKDDLSFCF